MTPQADTISRLSAAVQKKRSLISNKGRTARGREPTIWVGRFSLCEAIEVSLMAGLGLRRRQAVDRIRVFRGVAQSG